MVSTEILGNVIVASECSDVFYKKTPAVAKSCPIKSFILRKKLLMSAVWRPAGREGEFQDCTLYPCLCYLYFPHEMPSVNLPLPSQISPSILLFVSVPGQFLHKPPLLTNSHEVFCNSSVPSLPRPTAAPCISPTLQATDVLLNKR